MLGFKYDDTKTSNGRALTDKDLDAAAPQHPVYISHRGGHTAYVNALAYSRAGISEIDLTRKVGASTTTQKLESLMGGSANERRRFSIKLFQNRTAAVTIAKP